MYKNLGIKVGSQGAVASFYFETAYTTRSNPSSKACPMLDKTKSYEYTKNRNGAPYYAVSPVWLFRSVLDNRHRAGWRLSFVTRNVNTYPCQCTVTLIDIASPPLGGVSRPPTCCYTAPRSIPVPFRGLASFYHACRKMSISAQIFPVKAAGSRRSGGLTYWLKAI